MLGCVKGLGAGGLGRCARRAGRVLHVLARLLHGRAGILHGLFGLVHGRDCLRLLRVLSLALVAAIVTGGNGKSRQNYQRAYKFFLHDGTSVQWFAAKGLRQPEPRNRKDGLVQAIWPCSRGKPISARCST